MSDEPGSDPRAQGLRLYRLLLTTRLVEERLEVLHRRGRVSGGLYRSLGQEAGAVGAASALNGAEPGPGDMVAPPYRGCGVHLTRGATPEEIFRQFTGRAASPSGGRDSGAGWSDLGRGVLGPIAPLGTMVEVMAGVALAFQLRNERRVAMVFTGDGAASTGAWHEGLSVAAARRAPLVLVVENNLWAFSTRSTAGPEAFLRKGAGYGIRADVVDGTDVREVRSAAAEAVDRARSGEGVQLLELRYFRRSPHAPHDAQEYVDRAELAEWEARDPVSGFHASLVSGGWAEPLELDAIRSEIDEAVRVAAERVLEEAGPAGPSALEGVVSGPPAPPPWPRRPLPTPVAE